MPSLIEDLKQLQECYFKKPLQESSAKLLGTGFSPARNYRLEHSGKVYLARFMSPMQPLASRAKECLITDYAGQMGIGPKVYYQDREQGILITDFVEGRTANLDDMANNPNRDLIIMNLNKLHQSKPLSFPTAEPVTYYIKELFKRASSSILQQQLQALDLTEALDSLFQFEKDHSTSVLIHGDFNPNNILINGNRIYFIDWTNAGIGDPFVDIAWHALCLPPSSHDQLLESYFGEVDTVMQQKLIGYYSLLLFLRVVWAVDQAKMIASDSDTLLAACIKQKELPEPYELMIKLSKKEITLDKSENLMLVAAVFLQFLSKFTKTDEFISATKPMSLRLSSGI